MAIVIDLKIDDSSLSPAFARLEKSLSKLDATTNRLAVLTQQTAGSAMQAARGYSAMANQANRATSAATRAAGAANRLKVPGRFGLAGIGDPHATIKQYGAAALAGDGMAQKWVLAAGRKINQNNRVSKLVSPQPPQNPLMTAFMRSRFVQNGSKMVGMPLGADVLKLLASGQGAGLASILGGGIGAGGGASAAVGGLTAIVGPLAIAAAAVTAFAGALVMGSKSLRDTAQKMVLWGGSSAQTMAAARAANFTGVDPTQLMATIGAGGLPGATAAGMGVSPVRGPMGAMNDAGDYIKIAQQIGRMSPDQARRSAAAVGAPGLARLSYLTEGTRSRLLSTQKAGMSDKEMRASAEVSANLEIIGSSIARLAQRIAGPWVRVTARVLGGVADLFDRFGNVALAVFSPISALLQMMIDKMDQMIRRARIVAETVPDWVPGAKEIKKGLREADGLNEPERRMRDLNDQLTEAQRAGRRAAEEANTKALKELNKTLRDGEFGGGERVRNARPQGMRGPGYEYNQQYRELRPSLI